MIKKLLPLFVALALSLSFAAVTAFAEGDMPADDFTEISTENISAEHEGVVCFADGTHGLLPVKAWTDPAELSDEAYLIYRLGERTGEVYITLVAQIWSQNDPVAAEENAVVVSVSTGGEFTEKARYKQSGKGILKEEFLCEIGDFSGENVSVRIDLVQSKANCGDSGCDQRHTTPDHGTIATPSGHIDMGYIGVKLFSAAFSDSAPVVDVSQPVPDDFRSGLPTRIYASKEFVFPEIIFTDDVDGVVPHRITVTDPNNDEYDLGENPRAFVPEYEGMYIFEVSASDAAGNTYTDRFSVLCQIAPGAPSVWFESVPVRYGRVGVPYKLAPVKYDEKAADDFSVSVTDPDGLPVQVDSGTIIPTKVGDYRVIWTASNASGTSKLFARVSVKYNVGGGNVYEMVKDEKCWSGEMGKIGDSIAINGTCWCALPFPIADGIRLAVTLPSDPVGGENRWLGIYFTNFAGRGEFHINDKETYAAEGALPGLYVFVYCQSGDYFCDIDYVGLGSMAMVVANHTPLGSSRTLDIALVKKAESDNISLYLNGERNENYELNYSVAASVLSDNEGLSYIGFGNLSGSGASLDGVDIYDNVPPVIAGSGEVPAEAKPGSTVKLPSFTATDAHDGKVPCRAVLYSANGKSVPLSDGTFKAGEEGMWYYIVTAEDLSGNINEIVYEIKVGNTEKTTVFDKKKGCRGALGGTALFPLALAAIMYKKRARGGER